jgi:hypothetical protein
MNSYISLGFQYYSHIIFYKLNLSKGSLPYDYILSNPKFIYESLNALLIENCNIDDYVKNVFLNISYKGSSTGPEHFYTDNLGPCYINTECQIVFPHEPPIAEIIPKYIRRFNRLKNTILSKENYITFVYGSPISHSKANYTINGNTVIKDTVLYLNKIYEIMHSLNIQFRIIVFNSYEDILLRSLHKSIILINIPEFDHWSVTLDHIVNNYKDLILDSK